MQMSELTIPYAHMIVYKWCVYCYMLGQYWYLYISINFIYVRIYTRVMLLTDLISSMYCLSFPLLSLHFL